MEKRTDMPRRVDVGTLTTRPPFSDLFRVHPDILAGLKSSLLERGFDEATPIVAWNNTVVEGHTRLQAAKEAGLEWVWAHDQAFPDEDAALLYAIRAQTNRRNLEPAELLRCIARVDRIKAHGGDRRSQDFKSSNGDLNGRTHVQAAQLLGVSGKTVERARKVLANDTARQLVESGQRSISAAYNEVRAKERHTKEAAPPKLAPSLLPDLPPSVVRGVYTVAEWKALSERDRRFLLTEHPAQSNADYNRTNENVEWALWTWNPVTGCLHDCPYCYARDIAKRFYPQGFVPAIVPGRLHAPRKKKIPAAAAENLGERNVFTCSMADLFGKWVPEEWISAVFEETQHAQDWNFLYLTKFPQRLAQVEWPANAWCGTTVDRQSRVANAERSFRGVTAGIKWLSCEPLLERLTFSSLEMFDWVVIGGASESTETPAFQPPWEWVEHLIRQARNAGCRVYVKPNLLTRPREYPGWDPVEVGAPPPFFPGREPVSP
jgi:protein gp37